jgi:hypothetical protein
MPGGPDWLGADCAADEYDDRSISAVEIKAFMIHLLFKGLSDGQEYASPATFFQAVFFARPSIA